MEQASCLYPARHLGGTGILVEQASWWNRHLGGTGILPVSCPASCWNRHLACILPGILVEQASCLFHSQGHLSGTGILPVSCPASWWNRHLACILPSILVEQASCLYPAQHLGGTGILPVSSLRQTRCPPHSYSSRPSAMPKI
ncbi:hypothetical protein [Moorena sp. SIOASIH]|uniref:hypothetical protein n=1 Tax=Moorena sp. SIOASIH TaxID=2607817 RepID=UPI0025D71DF9|nr:hypothetical protein [Moorena sp. SIOASIH]